MFLFSGRRRPHLSHALDDADLGRILKSLSEAPRPGGIGMTDLHIARMADLLRRTGADDWDRRAHRFAVLAEATAHSGAPNGWLAREPDSADAMLLYAWAELVRGVRSGGMRDARVAIGYCYRAADLCPTDPNPWVVVLGISRLERDRRSMPAIWREVLARDPQHREAHLQMLGHLSPEEGGSRMQVLEFVDVVRARTAADAPTAAVELTAAVDQHRSVLARGGVEALMARDFWSQPSMAGVLDEVAQRWPQPGFLRHARALADLNLLAYALVTAERRREAAQVFPLLEGRVTAWPWALRGDPVEAFLDAQTRSVR
ncbi:hypothetical protein [Streptomyces humidus]|uniref:hypothetical protein n=1 Tax=Streptomyces humidus TaxID=52259 RepID=UPI003320A8DB